MIVYVLQHTHDLGDGDEDVKFIGVYSSEQLGAAAIAELSKRPGFIESPHGFSLEPYKLDETHWLEGYASKT
jgi:hypothetical protein